MESILISIRSMMGPSETYEHFDSDLIMHINTTLSVLTELGVGPKEGFAIADDTATWTDFIGDRPILNMVKSYVYARVRLLFDPPTSSGVIEALNKNINEFEWRINHAVETSGE